VKVMMRKVQLGVVLLREGEGEGGEGRGDWVRRGAAQMAVLEVASLAGEMEVVGREEVMGVGGQVEVEILWQEAEGEVCDTPMCATLMFLA
jgi:hypothetical protein